jgi:DNA-binding PadR family transcriptional regulator
MWDPRDIDDARQRDGGADRNIASRAGHDARERDEQSRDPRYVATRGLGLPRGQDRELIRVRERTYELNGPESRTLATIGAFRVVRTEDLRDPSDPRERGLKHLHDQGLVRSVSLGGRTRDVVVLTREGRDVLEARRREDAPEPRQVFYEGLRKPREVTHDAVLYRAYRRASERLRDQGADVRRVVLDYELKREYQSFLQECNREQPASDGRTRRDDEEVEHWAREHNLPYFDDQVHFPDVRIEYDDQDGHHRVEDIEVVTANYRGAHGASAARSGFTCYFLTSGQGSRGRGGTRRAGGMEDFL